MTLLTIGPAAAYGDALEFASELLAVAGLAVTVADLDGAPQWDDVGAVACLCSSDAVYRDRAAAAVSRLRAAGVEHLVVAGRPDADIAADDFLYVGGNTRATLSRILDALGVHG